MKELGGFINLKGRMEKLVTIVNEYDFDDVVKAVFCVNICIGNRSALESSLALNASICEHNKEGKKRINTYDEFCEFVEKIKTIMQPEPFEDTVIDDFGEVVIKVYGRPYNVIIGTGYNQVFGCLFFLEHLAEICDKKDELLEVLNYYSGQINFFKNENIVSEESDERFVIPSLELFERVNKYFSDEIHKYNLSKINETLSSEDLPIEKMHFVKKEDVLLPLFNTSMLLDLYDKWHKTLDKELVTEVANRGIIKLAFKISEFDLDGPVNILTPVQRVKDNKPIEGAKTYPFVALSKKGLIITMNGDEYESEQLNEEIRRIRESHKKGALEIAETISKSGDGRSRCLTINKDLPVVFLVFNSYTNIETDYFTFGKTDDNYFRCTALDVIYYLCFMKNTEELFDYLSFENDDEYEMLLGFGGDSTKFLTWKDYGHSFAKGAIIFNTMYLGHDTENEYVVDYYREKLGEFPFHHQDYILDNPFAWEIAKDEFGFYEYGYKHGMGFGGILKSFSNDSYIFFAHNLKFYIKTGTTSKYGNLIQLVDELNKKLMIECEEIFNADNSIENHEIQVMLMPLEYARGIDGNDFLNDSSKKYVWSDCYSSRNKTVIRYCVNSDVLYEDIMQAEDRQVETIYFKELFKPIEEVYPEFYERLINKLDEIKNNEKEVDVISVSLDYKWGEDQAVPFRVHDDAYHRVRKEIAKICFAEGIEQGEYYGKEANEIIRKMQKTLIEGFEREIKQYDLIDLHKKTLSIYATTIHGIMINKERYNSFKYVNPNTKEDAQKRIIKQRETAKHDARSLLYLIESNFYVDHESNDLIDPEDLEYLLAYANWLVVLDDNANICHFTGEETHIIINYEYNVDVEDDEDFTKQLSGLHKRMYDDTGDLKRNSEKDDEYCNKTIEAFQKDTGISFISLMNLLNYLQRGFTDDIVIDSYNNVFTVSKKELYGDFIKVMKLSLTEQDFDKLLNFLEMKSQYLKTHDGKEEDYLPIGDRKKRDYRFDTKPLLIMDDEVLFSPVTIKDVHANWLNGIYEFRLPYDIGMDNTKDALKEWKAFYEKQIVFDLEKVFESHGCVLVKHNFELYDIDKKKYPQSLGDYDVFAVDSVHKKIWIIECKVIDKVSTIYEMYRQQNRFFNEKKFDEKFQERIDFMNKNYKSVLEDLSLTSDEYEICPYMCFNKVMVSRYKEVSFPILSYKELCNEIEKNWEDEDKNLDENDEA